MHRDLTLDEWSKNVWTELKRRGHRTQLQEEEREREWKKYRRNAIKERYPVCCNYWKGMYIQKDMRKLIKRITKRNDAYSESLSFCPECGKRLETYTLPLD